MTLFFNNANGRKRVMLYGKNAFYDLNTTGRHATQAKDLRVGQRCVVATPAEAGKVDFTSFSFQREHVREDDTGLPCRVFFGKLIKSESLLKSAASRQGSYTIFFDKRGRFKRHSVLVEHG